MKITNTLLKVESITLHNNDLENKKFKILPKYKKKIDKLSDDEYTIRLSVILENTAENPFPADFSIIFIANFKFQDFPNEEQILGYMNTGAIQFMLPIIRSSVNSIFTSALFPPLFIPVIDVRSIK